MDLFPADSLLPVWDDNCCNEDSMNTFESFWPSLTSLDEDTSSESSNMLVDDIPYQQQYNNQHPEWEGHRSSNEFESVNQDSYSSYNGSQSSGDSSYSESNSEIEDAPNPQEQHHQQASWTPSQSNEDQTQTQAAYQHYNNHPYPAAKTEEDYYSNYSSGEPFAAVVNSNCVPPASEDDQQASSSCGGGKMSVDDPVDFKLPASKTPIMEAMVVCALNNWGLSVVKSSPTEVIFRVTDFDRYYRISRAICSKHRPTEDIGSRVKSLRRWFINFPKKKDRQENPNFLLSVKPSTCKKVHGLIERNSKLLNAKKKGR